MMSLKKNLKFRLYERAPMFICSLSFVIGIAIASSFFIFPTYYNNASVIIPTPIALLALVATFAAAAIVYGYKRSISIFVCIFMLLAGFCYSGIRLQSSYPKSKIIDHETISGKITSLSRTSDKSVTVILDDVKAYSDDYTWRDVKAKVALTIYGQSGSYLAGEYYLPNSTIKVKTQLEYPAKSLGWGYFNERMYMLSDGAAYKALAHHESITIVNENSKILISSIVSEFRINLFKNIEIYVGGEEAGLLKALLTGEKDSLAPSIKNAFASLGISHLLATSGLHIGILLLALSLILKRFKIPIIPSTIISGITIFLFMLLSGFRISIVRASLMWVVLIGSKLSGTKYNGINSLGVAMFVMMLLNPFCIYDTSFVLSCMSVMAILLLYKPINDLFKKNKDKKVWQIVSVTACVMIFTWPVMTYYFNSISLLAPIYNVIFIPVMSVLLIIMILFSLISGIPFIAPIFATIAKVIAFVVINLARLLEPLAFKLRIISPELWIIALWTIGVAILLKQVVYTKLKTVKVVGVALMSIAVVMTGITQYTSKNKTDIKAFSDGSTSIIYLQDNGSRALIMGDECYAAKSVLQKTLTKELDVLIFTGQKSSDLYKIMDDLQGYSIKKIYASKQVADEKYSRIIEEFDKISIGSINIEIQEFKAKSKTAKIHYGAIIEYGKIKSLYLDPMSLREGAFGSIEFDNVVPSKWSKSRKKNILNVEFHNIIAKDSKYLYSEFVDSLEQKGSTFYNINDVGAVSLILESEKE